MTPAQFEKFQALYPGVSKAVLTANAPTGVLTHSAPQSPLAVTESPGLRQRRSMASKLQLDFLDYLARSHPDCIVKGEEITLKLANGVRFTPDAWMLEQFSQEGEKSPFYRWNAYEVKGFMRDDAAVKLKVAASAWPWITFYLVTRKGRATPFQQLRVEP